ncbi:MAG: queuosine precursor transporter [Planktomarina sp.]
MTRIHLPGIIAMAAIVVASNVLVQYLLPGNWLTYGAFTYPLAFLVTDIMNRVYGVAAAQKVVLVGFVVGVICSLIGTQVMLEFGPAVTLRIAMASGLGFLVAQLLDIVIFHKLRTGAWWRAPLASTLIGSTVDTCIFFTIAFAAGLNGLEPANMPTWAQEGVPMFGIGPMAPLWISLAVADWTVKISIALLALIPFRAITRRLAEA